MRHVPIPGRISKPRALTRASWRRRLLPWPVVPHVSCDPPFAVSPLDEDVEIRAWVPVAMRCSVFKRRPPDIVLTMGVGNAAVTIGSRHRDVELGDRGCGAILRPPVLPDRVLTHDGRCAVSGEQYSVICQRGEDSLRVPPQPGSTIR